MQRRALWKKIAYHRCGIGFTFLMPNRCRNSDANAHPNRGGFLPPVALPRRMWAGGRFEFHKALKLGQKAEQRSEIKRVSEKSGRSGPLCFVTVAHKVWQGGALCVAEEQDLVFREDHDPKAPAPDFAPAPAVCEFSRTVAPSEVMAFSILCPNLQRSPHPLRCGLCARCGGLSRPCLPWAPDRDAFGYFGGGTTWAVPCGGLNIAGWPFWTGLSRFNCKGGQRVKVCPSGRAARMAQWR